MPSTFFSRPASFEDSSPMNCEIDKSHKPRHSCCKTLSLLVALVSYALALAFIIIDLFLDNEILGNTLNDFHARTGPLIPPKTWIAPLWLSIYGFQIPWLFYTITTLCRQNGSYINNDYLYKYPRPVSQMQLITFSFACWSHIIFIFLIQHQSNLLAMIYIVLGLMALIFCLITSIIHLHNYERELISCHLFGDIWSIRIFFHNGLSVMLAWQLALFSFTSLYICKTLPLPTILFDQINETTINLIGLCLIGFLCIIAIVYILFTLCCCCRTMYHVIAGWILLGLLTFSYWLNQSHQSSFLLLLSFYILAGLLVFTVCLHLILAVFYYTGSTWRSLTNSSRNNYRHDILQGKD